MNKQYFFVSVSLFFLAGSVFLLREPRVLNTTKSRAAVESLDLSQGNYEPNSVIVKFKDGQDPESLADQASVPLSLADKVALRVQNQQTPSEQLATIAVVEKEAGIQEKKALPASNDHIFVYKNDGRKSVRDLVQDYAALPQVEYVQPDYIYQPMAVPNDTHYSKMWSLKKINMPAAWDISTGSESVLVAVIDTGADKTHEDLVANIAEYKNFTSCSSGDSAGHGSHTAGTIGAVGNNGKGVTGISWKVKILVEQVDCRGIRSSALVPAINYAVQKGAKAINMSLGGPGGPTSDRAMAQAISNAVQHNTLVVASAGNDGRGNASSNYPSSDPNAISVSATGPNDELAVYSSYGSAVDITAPGGNASQDRNGNGKIRSDDCIVSECPLSTWLGNRYVAIEGTSMSAPHVTGLIGLMFAVNPNLTSAQVKQILFSTAVDLGTPGRDDKFGAGRIDAKAALDAVVALGGSSGQITPTLTQQPTPNNQQPTPVGATATPLPTAVPTTSTRTTLPTDIPPTALPTLGVGYSAPVLNLALRFQGIEGFPARNGGVMVTRVGVVGGTLDMPITQLAQFQGDADGIFYGKVSVPALIPGRNYCVLIKGPLHIQKKICHERPLEPRTGEYKRGSATITIKGGDNDLDFSGIKLLVGDVDQNGVVNSFDLLYVRNAIGSTAAVDLERCDVNWDTACNAIDYGLMVAALSVKTDDE